MYLTGESMPMVRGVIVWYSETYILNIFLVLVLILTNDINHRIQTPLR